jgi:4'-phosphopantetheinyl transferase
MSNTSAECLQHEVHVWLARPEPWPLPRLADRYDTVLSEEERQRYQRFYFEHDRKHYLAAHAMLRLALGHYLGRPPEQLHFTQGPNGKPRLAPQSGQLPLHFNLSHTRGMVACMLTLERDCGIDVEGIRSMKQMDGVAETVFSASELAYLANRDEASRLAAFFTLWTLKEAYIKATGLGMSAPLRQISIDPDGLRIRDESRPAHESQDWLVDSWQPAPGHALALASKGTTGIRAVVYHEFDLGDGSVQVIRCRQAGESPA